MILRHRLTITRTAATDTYADVPNGTFGNQALIDQIAPSVGPGLNYVYDAVGNVLDDGVVPMDRDGLLGGAPFVVTPDELWPFTGSASVAQQAREINASRHFGWRWAHCWASCNIMKMCGGRPLAKTMEWGKELLDVVKCFPEIFTFRKLDPDRNCASALQPSDFEDNEFGRSCPRQMGCDERCSPLIGKTSEPGPMYPIARGTQWFLEF